MRRPYRNRTVSRRLILLVSVWATLWGVSGALAQSRFGLPFGSSKKNEPKDIKSLPAQAIVTADYESVGDGAGIDGLMPIKVEGIGLVNHLPGTGSDPPPNLFRQMMMDELKKMEIYKPKELLASESTAVVLLRALVPPGCRKGDNIDVEVYVPNGDTTTSLKGGYLMPTSLSENMVGKTKSGSSKPLEGKLWVRVEGPVLVAENPTDKTDSAALKKGKILGGGRIVADRDFRIVFPKDVRSARRIKSVTYRINQRFFNSENGLRTGLANAKDDRIIELKLDKHYRYDIQRYLNVVRRLPLSTSETFQMRLLEDLKGQLNRPATALDAGLKLEAIGKASLPVLKDALASKSEVVRFSAAMSLAYLNDPAGIPELARLAEHSPEYRSYALTGLVVVDHTLARMQMARLLNSEGAETRYGAFRALWTYDAKDQMVRGEDVDGQFFLHAVQSKTSPMVHLARHFRREIVLFDGSQPILLPVAVRTDNYGGEATSKQQRSSILINAETDSEKIHIVRFRPAPPGSRESTSQQRVTCDNNLAEVIRQCGKLGATYPEVVELLKQMEANKNLSGRLEVNALPRAMPLEALQELAMAGQESGNRLQTERGVTGLFAAPESSNSPTTASASTEKNSDDEGENKNAKKPGLFSRWLGN